MNLRSKEFLCRSLIIIFVTSICAGASYAQPTVSISGPGYTSTAAPSGAFTVSATGSSIAKVVFYRNDVPYETDTSFPYELSQDQLGQDTYTYRARAYNSSGVWVDSSDVQLEVRTPMVIKMGEDLSTHGPDRAYDHTEDIRAAVDYLYEKGGGTLVFPCKIPSNDYQSLYNISDTITVPENVTIQSESARHNGNCAILLRDITDTASGCHDNPNGTLLGKPAFKIVGGTSRVRFRDIWLHSASSGLACFREDYDRIDDEDTRGIEMNADDRGGSGNITDVIIENVTVSGFTYGIKAVSVNTFFEHEISNIRIRGYSPSGNHRNLYINSIYAYNWDVQNLNMEGMLPTQGALEIVNAGRPSSYTGENGGLKFLQVNCNGNAARTPAFCVQVEKHGGLYFKQLHHELVHQALIVKDISPAINPDPIVFESGVATGRFYDASMKLYLIGNGIFAAPEIAPSNQDNGRLRFLNAGVNSTVVDCGDLHVDRTDVDPDSNIYATLMSYTHSERNRGSFFAEDSSGNKYIKAHRICPAGVSGVPDINQVGGEFFDSGVLPTEAAADNEKQFSNVLDASTCPSGDNKTCLETLFNEGGTVYIPSGSHDVNDTVLVPKGSQLIGAPNSELRLTTANRPLLQIILPVPNLHVDQLRATGNIIRNLTLKTTQSGTTGIEMLGEDDPSTFNAPGQASDIYFSGLTIQGFKKGVDVRAATSASEPQLDGFGMKNMSFIDNHYGVKLASGNASNWNVMNLNVESNRETTDAGDPVSGWYQQRGGHHSLQGVRCTGTQATLRHCISLQQAAGFYLNGLTKVQNVTNALTLDQSPYFGYTGYPEIYNGYYHSNVVLRDNDFTSTSGSLGYVNIQGKSYITSMNNRYGNFTIGTSTEANKTRLTHCADFYSGMPYSTQLSENYRDPWVALNIQTRIQCGTRPVPWEDAVRWGDDIVGVPLVGNFFDDNLEDFVVYQPGSQSRFLIQRPSGPGRLAIDWGTTGDIPVIGRFFPNSNRAQIAVFRPSTGAWWVWDPFNSSNYSIWNLGETGTLRPFVGNFLNESGSVTGNKDEIATYNPGTGEIKIKNPRTTSVGVNFMTTADSEVTIQVGDFKGLGYDQVAKFKNGTWEIFDPRATPVTSSTVSFGQAGDIAVAGKYFSGSCTQLGVWRPADEKFIVVNAVSSCGSTTPVEMIWGSNNGGDKDDIPLSINTTGGIKRPASYRPGKGTYEYGIADGQWWVHDPF